MLRRQIGPGSAVGRSAPSRGSAGWCKAVTAALVAGMVLACDREPTAQQVPSATVDRAAKLNDVVLGGGDRRSRHAFDLVLAEDGAELIWFSASPTPSLRGQRVDPEGQPRGDARELVKLDGAGKCQTGFGGVGEVAAKSLGTRLAVAWSERCGELNHVRVWLADADKSILEATTVGANAATDAPRGNLALGVSRGVPTLLARGDSAPCSAGIGAKGESCTEFGFVRVEPTGAGQRRSPLSVPTPCPAGIVGIGLADETWQYALCSLSGGSVATTLFSVEFEPQYARAVQLMRGCIPLGSVVTSSALLLAFECEGKRQLVQVHGTEPPLAAVELESGRFSCELGQLVFAAGGTRQRFERPQAGLEVLLPTELRRPGARAVWTGVALLMAYPVGNGLGLETHVCRGSALTRKRAE